MLCRVQARFQAFTSLLVVSILAGGTDAVAQGYFWLYTRASRPGAHASP